MSSINILGECRHDEVDNICDIFDDGIDDVGGAGDDEVGECGVEESLRGGRDGVRSGQ